MSDPNEADAVDTSPGGGVYSESDEHVPDATDATGTLDTSGTAGAEDSKVENTTPVFEAARAQDLQHAALAVDPDHPEVPESDVVLPEEDKTADEAREDVTEAAEAYREDPVKVQDPSITNAQENAEQVQGESPADTSARVQADQQQAAPTGGNTLDTSDGSATANAEAAEEKPKGKGKAK